jgi:hypothetical protein
LLATVNTGTHAADYIGMRLSRACLAAHAAIINVICELDFAAICDFPIAISESWLTGSNSACAIVARIIDIRKITLVTTSITVLRVVLRVHTNVTACQ